MTTYGVEVAVLAAFLEVSPATLRSVIRRHGIREWRDGMFDAAAISRHWQSLDPDCAECERLDDRGRRVADVEVLAALLGIGRSTLYSTLRRHRVLPLRRGVYDVDEVTRHRRHADATCPRCIHSATVSGSDRTP